MSPCANHEYSQIKDERNEQILLTGLILSCKI